MAHFAEIDENSIVKRVIVVDNNDLIGDDTPENVGISFLKRVYGVNTNWVQTSYNARFYNKFAGIGDTWDENLKAFISPKPFESWIFNNETLKWQAPITTPDGDCYWDEKTLSWIKN